MKQWFIISCHWQCRYGRDYYINDAKMSTGTRKTNSLYGDNHNSFAAHSTIDQDHNNNRNHNKRINTSSGSDHDTDSVSELEIIFNRKQSRHAVTLNRNVRKKWPPVESLMKRSMSLCSVRSYANKAINGNDRRPLHSSTYIGSSNCSLDQLTPAKSIGQIEEQALHSDIRRCSFRSRNGTNNFVVNPLFDEYGTEFWFNLNSI